MNYTLRQVVVGSCIAVVAGIIDGTIMFFGHIQESIPLVAIIAITFLAGIISATVDNGRGNMFELWGRKQKREPQSEAPRLPRDEGWEPFSPDFAFYFMDCPIEIKRAEWEESKITTVTDLWPLDKCAGLYWRRTGLYKEREEREVARKVADRLLGKIRLTSINVASAGSGYGNSLAQMGGNSLGQQQNNGMLGSLLWSSSGSLGPSIPFDPDRWI